MKHLAFAVGACLALAACGTLAPAPQTPEQALYEVKGDFQAALVIADAYAALPTCSTGGPALCKSAGILHVVREDADAAKKALDTASADLLAYRATAAGVSLATVNADIAAFQNTVTAFQSVTSTLKGS